MRIPEQARARCGFTLVELMIVVAIIGLVTGIAMPNFLKARAITQTKICIENLAQIESAKQIWGLENGKKDGDTATDGDLFGVNGYMKTKPRCPMAGTYDLKWIGTNATCTIAGHEL